MQRKNKMQYNNESYNNESDDESSYSPKVKKRKIKSKEEVETSSRKPKKLQQAENRKLRDNQFIILTGVKTKIKNKKEKKVFLKDELTLDNMKNLRVPQSLTDSISTSDVDIYYKCENGIFLPVVKNSVFLRFNIGNANTKQKELLDQLTFNTDGTLSCSDSEFLESNSRILNSAETVEMEQIIESYQSNIQKRKPNELKVDIIEQKQTAKLKKTYTENEIIKLETESMQIENNIFSIDDELSDSLKTKKRKIKSSDEAKPIKEINAEKNKNKNIKPQQQELVKIYYHFKKQEYIPIQFESREEIRENVRIRKTINDTRDHTKFYYINNDNFELVMTNRNFYKFLSNNRKKYKENPDMLFAQCVILKNEETKKTGLGTLTYSETHMSEKVMSELRKLSSDELTEAFPNGEVTTSSRNLKNAQEAKNRKLRNNQFVILTGVKTKTKNKKEKVFLKDELTLDKIKNLRVLKSLDDSISTYDTDIYYKCKNGIFLPVVKRVVFLRINVGNTNAKQKELLEQLTFDTDGTLHYSDPKFIENNSRTLDSKEIAEMKKIINSYQYSLSKQNELKVDIIEQKKASKPKKARPENERNKSINTLGLETEDISANQLPFEDMEVVHVESSIDYESRDQNVGIRILFQKKSANVSVVENVSTVKQIALDKPEANTTPSVEEVKQITLDKPESNLSTTDIINNNKDVPNGDAHAVNPIQVEEDLMFDMLDENYLNNINLSFAADAFDIPQLPEKPTIKSAIPTKGSSNRYSFFYNAINDLNDVINNDTNNMDIDSLFSPDYTIDDVNQYKK